MHKKRLMFREAKCSSQYKVAELDTEPRTFFSLESTLPGEERIMIEGSNWLETFPDKWQLEVSVGARWPLSSLGGRLGATESPRLAECV